MKKQLIVAGSILLAATFAGTQSVLAAADYTDANNETHYGWSLVCNSTEEALWQFGADGNISACSAAEGDIGNQRVNMYALRDIERAANEAYTVEATFTPDPESDLSTERTYGVVAWYVDSDNYLIYWLQQKTAGDWSGQFYGRVNGAFKAYVNNSGTASWNSGEYNDMWWDGGAANPAIRGTRNALLNNTVTLKVVSSIEEKEVGGTTYSCRKFELHQIVKPAEGAAEDFIADTYWCKDITASSPAARVGLYSEAFSFTVSGFAATGDNDRTIAQAAETQINALGTVSAADQIGSVEAARLTYERLLDLKSYLTEGTEAKLIAAENSVGAYVDGRIKALDPSSATFKDDVDEVYDLYMGLNDRLAATVTEVDLLKEMVATSQQPPIPAVSGVTVTLSKTSATVGETVTCTASATPSDAQPKTYTWYVNDVKTGGGSTYSLKPDAAGTYKIRCEIDGVKSAEQSVTFTAATGDNNGDNNNNDNNNQGGNGNDGTVNDDDKKDGANVGLIVGLTVGAVVVVAAVVAVIVIVRKKKN